MNYEVLKKFQKTESFMLRKLQNELPNNLYYHGIHHTIDVLEAVVALSEQELINEQDTLLLKTAALFHDSGFTIQAKEHEQIGCDIAKHTLPQFGFTTIEIENICGMILATKIPQAPKNKLEEIICDADLDYLGRDDYEMISDNLYREINQEGNLDKRQWLQLQINFLENHHYFTETSNKKRNQNKAAQLKKLKLEINIL